LECFISYYTTKKILKIYTVGNDTILVASDNLYVSYDAGNTWNKTSVIGPYNITKNKDYYFIACNGPYPYKMYRSSDLIIFVVIKDSIYSSMMMSRNNLVALDNGTIYFADYINGIFKAENNGSSWNKVSEKITNSIYFKDDIVFFDIGYDLYMTKNNFNTIEKISIFPKYSDINVIKEYNGKLYVGTETRGLFETSFNNILNNNDKIYSKDFILYQNYPNPFNPTTCISFNLPYSTNVKLKIYDISGKEIKTFIDGYRVQGLYNVDFDASGLPSGVYFYRLSTDKYIDVKKMLLIK